MLFSLSRLRLALLGKLGWQGLIRVGQQRALLKDVLRGALLVPFHDIKLREVRWYAWLSVPTSSNPRPRTRHSAGHLDENLSPWGRPRHFLVGGRRGTGRLDDGWVGPWDTSMCVTLGIHQ
jgi:hypothetical protein